MIESMATVRVTEAELARDLHALLAQVQAGTEIIVEHDQRPVAIINPPPRPGRPISECIAIAKAHEAQLAQPAVIDPEFAADVQAAIDSHREPLEPPEWD